MPSVPFFSRLPEFMLKRATDIALSATILLLTSPVLAAVAIGVWLDSGLPVLFRHERVGLNFTRFSILKFRTMRTAAGPSITVGGDSRVTRVGRILRRTKLDELPQFWNVLRGDMSIVGPRPEVPQYVELYRERYEEILSVRPGITDMASLTFRNEEVILAASPDPLKEYAERILPAKLDLAEKYVRTRSAAGDLAVICRTAAAILKLR